MMLSPNRKRTQHTCVIDNISKTANNNTVPEIFLSCDSILLPLRRLLCFFPQNLEGLWSWWKRHYETLGVMKTACSHPVFLGRSLTDPSPHAVRKATWRSPTAGARAQSQLSMQSPVSACTWRVPEENVQMFHLTSPYTEPSQLSEPSENAKMTFDLKSRDSLLWQ